jgi:DNA-binding beta-propeller fold protein YncE
VLRIAITPNGRTVYALGLDGMTPISTATNTAGPLNRTGGVITGIVFTPDSRTAYAVDASEGTVTPISVATGTAARPIKVGGYPIGAAIASDGKTVYVAQDYSGPSGALTRPHWVRGRRRQAGQSIRA